ncbi:hypothetical protein VTK26DRAFT_4510 [Humicola hyalothermophila]
MDENTTTNCNNQGARPIATLWGEIRAYLEGRSSTAPVAICPICQVSELSIGGLPQSGADADTKPAKLMLCGHMVCEECYFGMGAVCQEQGKGVRCPVCRHSLQYPAEECKHPIPCFGLKGSEEADDDEKEYLKSLPLTLPEGGVQPVRCNSCRLRHALAMAARIAMGVEGLVEEVKGFNHMEHDLLDLVAVRMRHMVLENFSRKLHSEFPSWNVWGGGRGDEEGVSWSLATASRPLERYPQDHCPICKGPIGLGGVTARAGDPNSIRATDFIGHLPCRHRGTCPKKDCVKAYYGIYDYLALPYTRRDRSPLYCQAERCGRLPEGWCIIREGRRHGGDDWSRAEEIMRGNVRNMERELNLLTGGADEGARANGNVAESREARRRREKEERARRKEEKKARKERERAPVAQILKHTLSFVVTSGYQEVENHAAIFFCLYQDNFGS